MVPEAFASGNAGKPICRPRQVIPEGGSVSNVPAVTMQDLELEQAELPPSRETLWCCKPYSHGGGSSVNQFNYGIGNTNQVGLINVSALNGDFSGNSFGW